MSTNSSPSIESIVDAVPVGLAYVDRLLKFTFANATYLSLTGRAREEVVGHAVSEILGPTFDEIRTRLDRALGGEEQSFHTRLPGTPEREIDVRYIPDRDDDSQVRGLHVVVSDVTEQRRAEELFRVLFEQSSDAHLIFAGTVEEGAGILACNNAAAQMLGAKDKADVIGRHPAEFSPERQPDGRLSAEKSLEMDGLAHEKGFHRFDWMHKRFDGEVFPCEVTLTPVTLSSGPALLVVWHDISERHRLAVERERQRSETQSILDHLPAYVWFKDVDDHILRVNQRVSDSLGVPASEMEGAPSARFYPEHAARYHADDLEVLGSGEPKLGIVEPMETPGGSRWVRTDKIPLPDEFGRLTRILVVATDVTDLKHAEFALAQKSDELVLSNRELTRSNEDLEEFARSASHDLRTPLLNVRTLAQFIMEDIGELTDEVRGHFGLMLDRINLMDRLLTDLLGYSRIGRKESQPTAVDLEECLAEVVELVAPPTGIVVRGDGRLPTVHAPRSAVDRVLLNLVSNAVKHHDRDTGLVVVSAADEQDRWVVVVSDDGPGIAEEFHERVFGMFETLAPRTDSSGIGLASVRKTLETLGGAIRIESDGVRGTTFEVTIPKRPDS